MTTTNTPHPTPHKKLQSSPSTVTSGQPSSLDQTPLMKQYFELKAQVPGALLLFRMGDFYELFGDDAVSASEILEITLTSRDRNKPNPMPMAGVPHHSIQGYIQRLLRAGKKIAIGEQVEDPALTHGTSKIVKREIVRVLTPGVQFDSEGHDINLLATVVSVSKTKELKQNWVLCCLEASTGEVLISDPLSQAELIQEMRSLSIRHFLNFSPDLKIADLGFPDSVLVETLPSNYILLNKATELLCRHYEIAHLSSFLKLDAAILGLGALLTYVLRSQLIERLPHLRLPQSLHQSDCLLLGGNSASHLDLYDLFKIINHTRSTLGTRVLKKWIHAPLRNPIDIKDRQVAVREMASLSERSGEKLSSLLSQVSDLERIMGRIHTGLASPRDTLALGQSLAQLRPLAELLKSYQSKLMMRRTEHLFQLSEFLGPTGETLVQNLRVDAPLVSRDGGIFNYGTTPELDRLLTLTADAEKWLTELERRERELTQIPSLKVRYNRVFGYYIEITQAHLKNVPPHYQRKQTMVGAERFFTEELKKFEEEILTASHRQKALEQVLFNELIEKLRKLSSPIMDAAVLIGEIDSLAALGKLSLQPNWCFPEIEEGFDLEICSGRHPMVELARRGGFVPNSLYLSPQTRLTLLITGPNMGGKSTVMRQTALIVILGQMGAPIPAASARWGAVSSVYTRIGAQDAISQGLSTFMVEMSELADILHHADQHSLIILDEIGRGTSTYDGISVAWSTLEWICNQIKARTLFATHYHELTQLSSTIPLLANAHMAVASEMEREQGNSLRFLYELRENPTNESFGIHVAQLAGLPKPVIERAWRVLEELEGTALSGQTKQSVEEEEPSEELASEEGNDLSAKELNEESSTEALSDEMSAESETLTAELSETLNPELSETLNSELNEESNTESLLDSETSLNEPDQNSEQIAEQLDRIAALLHRQAEEDLLQNPSELKSSFDPDAELARQIAEDLALEASQGNPVIQDNLLQEVLSKDLTEEELIQANLTLEGLTNGELGQEDFTQKETPKIPIDIAEIQSCIEALLFISDKPLPSNRLRQLLAPELDSNLFEEAMVGLCQKYQAIAHGIEVVEIAGGYQFRTKPGRASLAQKLAKVQTQRLSSGCMETLAIIAYRQPSMKEDIDKVRGVDSSYFLRGLMEKKLIKISGRSELPGRPSLYCTTPEFLEVFGLRDLNSLPSLRELEQMIPSSQSTNPDDEDPRIKTMRRLVNEMNVDGVGALKFDPKVDDQLLKEFRDRITAIPSSTPYLDDLKAAEILAKQQLNLQGQQQEVGAGEEEIRQAGDQAPPILPELTPDLAQDS
ncbi:unnamed protein product [Sphagnum tenellum]